MIADARKEFERKIAKPKETFENKVEAASTYYGNLLNEFYSQNLVDKNEKSVMPGHIISEDGVTFFKVKKRAMSGDHNGNMTFPFVVCTRMGSNKLLNISDSDLKKFEIKGKGASDESKN